ncbi:type III secretion system protein MxiG [Shigella flexneri]|nr:protein mxiG [Shigella flexneri]
MSEAKNSNLAPFRLLVKLTNGVGDEFPLYYGNNLIVLGRTIETLEFGNDNFPENIIPVTDSKSDGIIYLTISKDNICQFSDEKGEQIDINSQSNSFEYDGISFHLKNMREDKSRGHILNGMYKNHSVFFFFAVIIVLIIIFSLSLKKDEVKEIAEIIDDKRYGIVNTGQCNYILAETQNDAVWASVALNKTGFTKCRYILVSNKEINRIQQYINQRFPFINLYVLNLVSDKAELLVFLSKERNSSKDTELDKLKNALIVEFPYIKNIKFNYLSDHNARGDAKGIFTKVNVQYKEICENNKVTYSVREELTDEKLELINRLISEHKKIYGDQYIEFSVLLIDDDFKGKSYLNSKDSYVMLNDKHWFFFR